MATEESDRGVDKEGQSPVDPTRNVLDLVAAAITRQDDRRDDLHKLFDSQLAGLKELIDIRFAEVQRQFEQIEASRKEQKVDTKTAVDAALSAAEKAVKEQELSSEKAIQKSETGAAEQFKSNAATFMAQLTSLSTTIGDIKERVGKMEAIKLGNTETRSGQNINISQVISAVMALIALSAVVLAVLK